MFLLGIFLFVAGCNSATGGNETATVTATVTHSDLEGGFFYLKGDNGVNYDPTNLPTAYQQDGKRVKAKVRIRNDLGSVHAFGVIVEILEISAI